MKDKLTTIAYHTYPRALLMQAHLEAAGIDCFITNLNNPNPTLVADHALRVRNKDVEKAMRILEKAGKLSGKGKEKIVTQMHSIRRILVAVDFSEYSANACRYAIGLAAKFKAEVKLFHAYFKPVMEMPTYEGAHMYQMNFENYFEEIEIRANKQLHSMLANLNAYIKQKKIAHVRISATSANGFAEDAIIEMAETYRPGIVIIGTHGIGETTEGIFGSVTSRLVDRLNIPLLAVPANATYLGLGKIRHMLYATDFDESDYPTLSKLINLIRPFKMTLHCVHVSIGRKKPWDPVKMDSLNQFLKDEYPQQKIKTHIIVSDDIMNGLETYMRNHSIGAVAVNTHKRSLFTQLFIPSITRRALARFNKPVFVFQTSNDS